jgi:hypothetical protein
MPAGGHTATGRVATMKPEAWSGGPNSTALWRNHVSEKIADTRLVAARDHVA